MDKKVKCLYGIWVNRRGVKVSKSLFLKIHNLLLCYIQIYFKAYGFISNTVDFQY